MKENYVILQTKLHYESAYSLLHRAGILIGKSKTVTAIKILKE